jgi:hypothetical protein
MTIACRGYRLIEGMLSLRAIDNVKLMISSWLLLGCGLSAKYGIYESENLLTGS